MPATQPNPDLLDRVCALEGQVRRARRTNAVLAAFCAVLALSAFAARQRQGPRFAEIDVERINIIESDGRLRMVISNQERQHPGIVNGKVIPRQGPRPPGLIFFNHLGDEMGGLVFGENGGIGHFGSLTWDKVRGDQTIGFRHLEGDNGAYQTGLEMWQQPNVPGDVLQARLDSVGRLPDEARRAATARMRNAGELPAGRLFLGKRRDNSTALVMSDTKGRPRVRLQVAPDGAPGLEFLDSLGAVVGRVPEIAGTPR